LWEAAGIDLDAAVPREHVMTTGDMVDAALAGLDSGETVTIPSLPDVAAWHAYEAARMAMVPVLSLAIPAPRYRPAMAQTAGA
jgi:short-subunit dehydrogenase